MSDQQYTKYNFEDPEGTFVDLTQNSEAYTGYNGTNIWPVVYQENCFVNKQALCMEDHILNRLISGVHSSINCHISEFFVDLETNRQFNNRAMFFERVGNFPERIENLYFTYSIFLRAFNLVYEYL